MEVVYEMGSLLNQTIERIECVVIVESCGMLRKGHGSVDNYQELIGVFFFRNKDNSPGKKW